MLRLLIIVFAATYVASEVFGAPSANQESGSLALVISTQVQPVSLHTR